MALPPHTILEYIRKGKPKIIDGERHRGPKIGVLLAIKTSGGYSIGYSMCHRSDAMDTDYAINLAIGRAITGINFEALPHAIKKKINAFIQRCNRYYTVKKRVKSADLVDDIRHEMGWKPVGHDPEPFAP